MYRALVVPGKGGRFGSLANPGSFKTEHRDEPFRAKSLIPRFQEKPLSFSCRRTVPQTDTGRQGENPKALERTRVKELGNIAP